MEIEKYEQRVLTPSFGKWLCNTNARVISNKVFLGKNADQNEWAEITQEEKEQLEEEWENQYGSEI